jgi:uncharacterized protein YndB with AHSA1/START domain
MGADREWHDAFSTVRHFPCKRTEVWAAWSIREKKAAWLRNPELELDFRVGGRERSEFSDGDDRHVNETRFFEIAHFQRIVLAYSMAKNGRVHSVSLATITFDDEDGGTRFTYNEQMCILPPSDGVEGRRHGWSVLLDMLGAYLSGKPA